MEQKKKLIQRNTYTSNKEAINLLTKLLALISFGCIFVYGIIFDTFNSIVIFNLLITVVFCIVLNYVNRKIDNYRIIAIIFCAYTQFIVMPILIINGAQARSSAPIWYAAGIMVMIFILDKRDIWWMPLINIYIGTYFFTNAYIAENTSSIISDRTEFFFGFVFSFLAVSFTLLYIMVRMDRSFKKAEEEIEKSHEMEHNAGLAKSRFLANMSHEIRTPMNSIIGLSEIVLKDEMDDRTRDQVNIIKKSAYDLLEIIDDVLMYSKLDSSKMKLLNADFKTEELLKSVTEIISTHIEKKDLKVRIIIDNNIPKVVNGDDIRIKQVIMRLVFISLSLTDNGRLMFSVSCDTNEEDKKARFKIKVSDTGCGLSQVDCNAIFGAYDTYDSRQSSNLKGIGLKFNICKDLLAMMNGDMIIRSIEGVGLESEIAFECDVVDNSPMLELIEKEKRDILIYIKDNRELETWKSVMSGFDVHPDYANSFFAFDKAISTRDYDYIFVLEESYATVAGIISTNAKEDNTYVVCSKNRLYGDFGKCRILWQPICSLSIIDALNDTWKASNYESKNEKIEYDGSEAKILVVDDNAVNLKVASGIFKGYNIEIDTAKSGSESLKKLEEKEYNLVLMDMVMPEMSGEETLKKIRESKNKAISEIPVVALTANTGGNIREEILSLGFQEYLAKPIKTRYLTQILLDFLPPGMLKRKLVDNKPSTPVVKESSKPKESLGEIKDTKIKGLVTELKEALDNMDLTLCNTLFEKFKGEDIDPGVSLKVKEIKKAYDVYDFEKIKEMISVI